MPTSGGTNRCVDLLSIHLHFLQYYRVGKISKFLGERQTNCIEKIFTSTHHSEVPLMATNKVQKYPSSGSVLNLHKSNVAANARFSPRFGQNFQQIYLLAYCKCTLNV